MKISFHGNQIGQKSRQSYSLNNLVTFQIKQRVIILELFKDRQQ